MLSTQPELKTVFVNSLATLSLVSRSNPICFSGYLAPSVTIRHIHLAQITSPPPHYHTTKMQRLPVIGVILTSTIILYSDEKDAARRALLGRGYVHYQLDRLRRAFNDVDYKCIRIVDGPLVCLAKKNPTNQLSNDPGVRENLE